jgi:hypothetical protein
VDFPELVRLMVEADLKAEGLDAHQVMVKAPASAR